MTHLEPPPVPACPACGSDSARRTEGNERSLGRYYCDRLGCQTLFDGGTSEWTRPAYVAARERWREAE